jgi:hypothetical protein
MMDDPEQRPAAETIREAIRALRGTPAGERLRSHTQRTQHAAEALLRSPDPIMREVGGQLRDGAMRPSDVLRIPEYRDAFQRAAEQARDQLDPKKVAAELERLAERDSTGQRRDGSTDDRDRREDRTSSW